MGVRRGKQRNAVTGRAQVTGALLKILKFKFKLVLCNDFFTNNF